MGIVQGLAAYKDLQAKKSGGDFKERVKVTWISLKGGEETKLIFLQEIDAGSPNYNEKLGLALLAGEHTNPEDWKRTALCTEDSGEGCYGCENNWRTKQTFYINALVDNGKDEPYVAVWSRGLGKGSVAAGLYAMAGDDDYELSISDKTFKYARTGNTKDDTTYTLTPLPKPHGKDLEKEYGDKLWDLNDATLNIPYERQEAFYTSNTGGPKSSGGGSLQKATESKPQDPSSINADW